MDSNKKTNTESKTRKELIESLYRLSGLQQGMLFHGLYNEGKGAYLEQMTCDFTGLDLKIFNKSWDLILKKHSVLRTAFIHNETSVPLQAVYKVANLPVEILDYSKMKDAEQTEAVKKFEEADRNKGFDFNVAPLMRIALIKLSKDRYHMLWTWHHILFDGWSMPVLMQEFLSIYELFVNGKKAEIGEIDRFEDYIKYIERRDKDKQEKYWRKYMKGLDHNTLLPFVSKTSDRTKGEGSFEKASLTFNKNISEKISAFVQKNRLTTNTIFQGVWAYLLHKYTASSNVVFGAIVSGRPDDLPGVEQRVGLYINTLPLHSVLKNEQSVIKWLQDIQYNQLSSGQYQYTPLQDIQRWTGVSGDFFDSILVFENYPVSEIAKSKKWSIGVENIVVNDQTNYPMTILVGGSDELSLIFHYNKELLSGEFINEISDHFENVITQMISNGESKLDEIKLLSKSEEEKILEKFNDTKVENPKDKTIAELFEAQATKTPDAIALVFDKEKLTYKELNERANKIAHYLRSKSVKDETLVPICIERSLEMIVGVIAILKAGGAYVPVDPDFPLERIEYMLENSGAALMLASKKTKPKLNVKYKIEIIEIDNDPKIDEQSIGNLNIKYPSDNLAYMLYTSGSTGNPKGVRMPGSSLVNLLMWQDKQFVNKERNVLQFTSLNFDVSFQEIFSTLCFGSSLYLINAERRIDMSEVLKDIQKYKITHLFVPFIVLKNLAEHIATNSGNSFSLEEIITAGEQLKLTNDIDTLLKKNGITLVNQYGPTEAHVVSSYTVNIDNDPSPLPPIGKPIDNVRLYILGENFEPVPVGVSGELFIGGEQLARGYLNLPEQTEEKFIKDPFGKETDSRMYKTGDICRWLPDGNIEYLGRADDQIKIRGYRVELGEIESVLQESDSVRQAVVLSLEDKNGNKRLAGYIVANEKFDKEKIAAYLKSKLPDYMVPSLWVEMDSLPLTQNGKIDKRALPDPDITELINSEYAAPRNETEEKLAVIWQELLGISKVGINDNFFELGGHSLLVMRVISSIRREMDLELSVKDVFIYPTIAELSFFISTFDYEATLPPIKAEARPEFIPLSFSQDRLWFIDKLEGSVQYHLPAVLRLKGSLNTDALTKALQTIVNRHEILRTVILEKDGNGYQVVTAKDRWKLQAIDGSAYVNDREGLLKLTNQLINAPFDLTRNHLMRGNLISLNENDHILVVTLHHIASDGWSVSILVKEFTELYNAYTENIEPKLNTLPIQYADYSIWQKKYIQGEVLDLKLDYWKKKLKGTEPLELPTDFTRPAKQSSNGAVASFIIDAEQTEKLVSLSKKYSATLFMSLMSAFNILLHRYSGQEDICVGVPVSGRQQKETENLIGFFINTIALRVDVSRELTFTELLEKVKETTLEAFEHQDAPFEKVVDALEIPRDMGRTPIFGVTFALQNMPDVPDLRLKDLTLSNEEYDHNIAKFDITINITQTSKGLEGSLEYCSDLFKEDTIERLLSNYKELLQSIATNPEEKIGLLPIMTKAEEYKVLTEFNETEAEYSKDKTIIELFEIQSEKTPEAKAIIFEDKEMTYSQLNERSNQLAHFLKKNGVTKDTLVPVCLERSLNMFVGILGILKAGGAYVPIDPEYPQDRISFMLSDIGASIVLSSKDSSSKLTGIEKIEIIETDGDWDKTGKYSKKNFKRIAGGENLAYVIYTSGSTGKPKGVLIEHRNILSYILNNKTKYISDNPGTSGSFLHLSYTFDASLTGMFMPLLFGKSVVIGSKQSLEVFEDKNFQKYAPYDFIKITPSHIELLNSNIETFSGDLVTKKLVVGGEALLRSQLKYFMDEDLNIEIINEYGPTEATVGCTVYSLNTIAAKLESEINFKIKNNVPIGKPIDNVQIYILGEDDELAPVGVSGEICIGGDGVARGYLNRPDLTAEKFVKNKFSDDPDSKLYKTGDLGRWLSDGNIEYTGRKDDQVKIRGFRIELGEIENVLLESGLVKQSVIIAKKNKEGNSRLVGYVVANENYDKPAMQEYLQKRLPEYMIPAQWMEIETLPLTSNGKIDKKKLPDPEVTEILTSDFSEPRNDFEKTLSEIWKDLLEVDSVGINDNFFELGGDSIIIIQIVSRAKRLGIELQVADIFSFQTIALLSENMAQRSETAVNITGEQGLLTGDSGLLPIQQWYFEGNDTDLSFYNQTILLNIEKSVTDENLKQVFAKLTSHHDALRFKYYNKDGKWIQEYGEEKDVLTILDLNSSDEKSLIKQIEDQSEKFQKSLDIEKGEVVRVVLMKTPEFEKQNRILIAVHHLVVDGVSWRIILDDLESLLNNIQNGTEAGLGNKSSSYRQWYDALVNYGSSNRLLLQKPYWDKAVESYEPVTTDKEYSEPIRQKDLQNFSIGLDAAQTQLLLQEVPRVYHTEINDLLLCALALTLCESEGKNKIVIGLEGHGREDIAEDTDTSRTVGWFTSMYPVLLETAGDNNLSETIKKVKEQLRRVPDKGLGFGVLKHINCFNEDEKFYGKECWDIVFNYLGQLDKVVGGSKWVSGANESSGAFRSGMHIVHEKISVNSMINGGKLNLNWSYSGLHFDKKNIEALAEKYKFILESLISHCIEQQKSGSVFTPSDYGLGMEIGYDELDRFMDEPFRGKPRRESVEGLYRLSGLQEGMLFHAYYDSTAGAYMEQLKCDLINPDLEIINKSWKHVLSLHSILRSGFYYNDFSIPVQCVYKELDLPVTILDYREMTPDEQAAALIKFEEADRLNGFDFKSAPLMRVNLIRLSEDRYRMLWTSHHILFDGWSMSIILGDFLSAYEQLITGKEFVKAEEDKFEDYIRYIERVDKDQQELYWQNYMKGIEQATLLPFISSTTQRTKGIGEYEIVHLNLNAGLKAKIDHFTQKYRLTINSLMQGVWAYILNQYTGNTNVAFGVIVSGRPDDLSGVEQRVGLYINTLPLHAVVNKNMKTVEWLQELQNHQVASRQYQYTPLQESVKWSGVSGDLFDNLLVFENYPVSEIIGSKEWSLQVENFHVQEQTNYPLTVTIGSADEIKINFNFNKDLLSREYVNEICGHFENVLQQFVKNEDIFLRELEVITKTEEQKLLYEFNDAMVDFPKDKTIVDFFEEQAAKTPDNTAVVFENEKLTYKELNERSNKLANYLQSKGVKAETLVPICIERSFEMIIGILGILKAGGAYVPVDPDYPEERINYIIDDTNAAFVVSSKDARLKLPDSKNVTIIEIDEERDEINKMSSDNLKRFVKPENLAYIIYTSGSTGKPKGVLIEHCNVVRLLKTDSPLFDFTEKDVWTMFHSFSFDFSVWEVYGALLFGGKLVIVSKDVTKDSGQFVDLLEKEKVTVLNQIPSAFYVLQESISDKKIPLSVRYLIFGGEALDPAKLRSWKKSYPDCKIINMYGITETTVHVTYQEIGMKEIESGNSVIGKPIPTLSLHILDKDQKLLPVGIAGELCVGGAGLARGYLNRPELTSEKFIKNPFSEDQDSRLYRSGDLGMRLPDGNIEYLGRIDEQVKIRGYRIELGEIESVLNDSVSVSQAIVLAKEDKLGNKFLVGYIIPEKEFDRDRIISYLKEKLPEYMVPALWVEMESFPLAASGKINKKALPEPDAGEMLKNEFVEPRTELETKLAEIWKELLNIERAGIYDNFFDLGGHSLLAMRAISSIRKQMKFEIDIKDIFTRPTIAEMAEYLGTLSDKLLLPAVTVQARPERIPLSFSQERLWFIDKMEGSIQYHMPTVLRLRGELNKDGLENAMQQTINRHEVLRTVLREEDGVGYQIIKNKDEWKLEEIDGSVFADDLKGLENFIQDIVNIPFDLSEDYMMRAHLLKLSDNEHILVLNMHHIASDGWSVSVLVREISEFYAAFIDNRDARLLPLNIQYVDYAIWQRKHLHGEVFERKLNFWKQNLRDVEMLQLPTDFPRPVNQSINGGHVPFSLNKELSDKLIGLSKEHNATLFMTLLAAFNVLLYRYSGQSDINIGIGIAGRQTQEMEDLIGFFVNTMVMRNELNGDFAFSEFIENVKVTTLDAYANQEVPFEKVVDAVMGDRILSKNPLVQVSFVLQNMPEVEEVNFGKLVLSKDSLEHTTSKFDLTLYTMETPDGIQGIMEYSTDLFRKETVEKMVSHFVNIVKSIVKNPDEIIGSLQMLSQSEKHQLLYEFNDTFAAYPKNRNVVELFEEQSEKTPDAVALVFEGKQLSYKELNEQSNILAHYLLSKGVTKETLIPVCIERSFEMITGILAVLKAGGAYVPIDPDYPADRISFMLEDTGAKIVLGSKYSIPKLPDTNEIEIVEAGGKWSEDFKMKTENPNVNIKPDNLAYVIYTSGSTGKPKGVLIEHSSVVNLISWHNNVYEVDAESKTTTMAGVGFDAFGWEVWPYLSAGATIHIIDDEMRVYASELLEYFNKNELTHCFMATALIPDFVNASRNKNVSLKYLLTGGDKLSSLSKEGLNYKLVNNYGPTENTVVTTYYELPEVEKYLLPPIGKPISNANVQIISKDRQLVPVGVIGEINIGGASLARGYLNRPELTEEKFVTNNFYPDSETRMYRTGDLGRWMPDGNIEFSGRLDDQVKIRGYRIELGEIETVMNNLDAVNSSCVLVRPNTDNKLVGYYVPNENEVKIKERELYQRQISGWKELYDTEYSKTEEVEDVDVEFNIIGWNDSFTGGEIIPWQMKEWVDDIVEEIISRKPVNVLEIGSGTGLIYYRIAEEVKKYIGTDFSRSAIEQIKQRVSKGLRNYCETDMRICAAHEIELSDDENIDTIILNSIVQYFPGEDYMSEVIGKSISLLKGKGRIIVGDVRDNRLLEYFKGRLHLPKLQHSATIKEFKWAMDQEVLKEEELCFSPEYFYHLQSLYPQITNIEIKWKQASYINELSLYRFTAVITVGIEEETYEPDWQSWDEISDKNILVEKIKSDCKTLALKHVPNPKQWKERILRNSLNNKAIGNVGDLLNAMDKMDNETIAVNELLEFAKSKNYSCRIFLDEDPMKVNLLIEKNDSIQKDVFVKMPFSKKHLAGNTAFTNTPLFNDISLVLKKDIRAALQESLPDYMVPSDLIALNNLPLTNNGKVDRKFLSQREDTVVINKLNYKAPESGTEKILANIWQEFLGVERIGVHDNFFELGGHSLLGMRVISSIRKNLESELAIKDLFTYPTIAELSIHLDSQTKGILLPAIEPLPRPELIPLSFSQERLWFIDKFEGSIQYHIPAVLRFKGKLNVDALEFALQSIINRHEVLRTVILEEEGKGYQSVKEKDNWKIEIVDGSEYKENAEGLHNYLHELIVEPFKLSEDYMMRAHLVKISAEDNVLVLTTHHIASDGWSSSVIVKELVEFYESFVKNREAELESLKIQYADYAMWQRENIQGEVLDKKLEYWKDKLDGVEPLQLPIDFPRPAVQSTKGANVNFNINKELSETIISLSQQHGSTLFMTMLAAFNVLMNRYSGQENICVGSPIAGRQNEEVESLIGFFINTLALRNDVESDAPFTELLHKVRTTTLEAYENQEIPFEKVVEAASKQRDINRTPLFQVMFVLQNMPDVPELALGDLKLSHEVFENYNSKFDITLFAVESENGLECSFEYCTDLFKSYTIVKMVSHFKELLKSIVKNPEEKIGKLQMLSKAEEQQLSVGFNDNVSEYPRDKSIVELFEDQVSKTPDAVAVVFENEKLSYKELNERSNKLAHYLQSKGVKKESLVPVCIERSSGLMVGILGVLKAGCAYVPIDPEYPEERIRFMLKDTGSSMIVSSKECVEKLPALEEFDKIEIDNGWKIINDQPSENLQIKVKPDELAYVIYTSGSTGWPKGVMVTQRNVVSLVKGVEYVKFTKEDILLSTGSTSFDATTFEYWGMLLNGGQLVLCTEDRLLDSGLLKEEIETRGVTKMWFTSSWFNNLIENDITIFAKLKTILAGGEKLSEYHIEKMRQTYPEIEIINGYGPTENTTFSLTYNIKETEIRGTVPIGIPLNNRTAYILNSEQQLVPIGVTGEVYLGGDGLSKGYLNNPELTNEKFIKDIFSKDPNARLYKTGDLGRWLPDGNIEYLGRKDEQVKIRGYRIELGEIEAALNESEFISNAVVLARSTPEGVKRLVGYVVPEGIFDREEIKNYLSKRLPDYMVPAIWVEMESLPLTANGKIDKNALQDPEAGDVLSNEYVAPRNETETALAGIWKDLLRSERVGIHDNFFELGGDSIITIQVVSRARRLGYEIKPKEIFLHQTIASLSEALAEKTASIVTGEQGILTGFSGLIPIQQWYFEETDVNVSHFNQSVLLSLEKSVTPEVLSDAVDELIKFHDALRFKYNNRGGEWIQEYGEHSEKLITLDLTSADKESFPDKVKEHSDKYNTGLDIEKGEISKFVLIQTPEFETHNRILIVVHHLSIDGVSWRILLEDLELLLNGIQKDGKAELGNKGSSFRQWYEALEQFSQSKRLLSQSKYWEKVVSNYKPLEIDKEFNGKVKAKDIESETISLDSIQTQLLLQEVPRVYHTEINDILLCALALTVSEWSKNAKVTIGMEGHGRENISESIDTSRTVGWFTSLYPVLLEVNPDGKLSDAIRGVKEQLRKIPDKGLGYGVMRYINKNEKVIDASGKDSWDIVFNYLGQLDKVVSGSNWLSGAGESAGEFRSSEQTVSEKLSFSGMIRGGELVLSLSYSSLQFKKETIENLINKYKITLESLIKHCIDQQKKGVVFTPSDYNLGSEISVEELDQFLKVDDKDDIMSF